MTIYSVILFILFSLILFYLILKPSKTRPCIDKHCNGTMKSITYIGDGDGPEYDHIHYICDKCGKQYEELVENK